MTARLPDPIYVSWETDIMAELPDINSSAAGATKWLPSGGKQGHTGSLIGFVSNEEQTPCGVVLEGDHFEVVPLYELLAIPRSQPIRLAKETPK